MLSQRWRPVCWAGVTIGVIWLLALAGYRLVGNTKMTAAKVKEYAESVDISQLKDDARAKAIQGLADRLNALSLEERRKARLEQEVWSWFERMTEAERAVLLSNHADRFQQMLASFEQPDDKRRSR